MKTTAQNYTSPQTLPTQRLKRLAIDWIDDQPDTKRERQEAIRACRDKRGRGLGGLSLAAALDAVERVSDHCRQERMAHRSTTPYRKPRGYVLPMGTPSQRLRQQRRRELIDGLHECLREYAREEAPILQWVDDMQTCSAKLEKEEGWIDYMGWAKPRIGITSARYTIRAMDRLTVPRVIDGLLTLGSERATDLEREGEQVHRAVWARQAQDGPERETGYIVCTTDQAGDTVYAHGGTVSAARATLTRRIGTSRRMTIEQWERMDRWREAARRRLDSGQVDGDLRIHMRDARSAGLCEAGVRAWCARHGIDPEGGVALRRVLDHADDHRSLVMAACMAALQRQHRADV